MNIEYPACDPIVAEGHPKCWGTLLPVSKDVIEISIGEAFKKRKEFWKCSICGREVQ